MDRSEDVLDEQPIAGLALAVVVAAIGYAAVTYVIDGNVNLIQTAVFAVVFAVVYVGFTRYFDV